MAQPSSRQFDDPALDAGGLLVRLGLALLAIVVPVSVVFTRHLLTVIVPIGALLILVGGLLLPHVNTRQRLWGIVSSTPGLSGLALLGWCILSLAWTPFPLDAVVKLWKVGGIVALVAFTVALLPERTRTSNLYLFPIGLAAASVTTFVMMLASPRALFAIQPEGSGAQRAATSLVVLVWPAIGALAIRDRWTSATLMALGVTVAAISAWTSVALAALAVGALVFAAATWNPPRVARSMGVLAVILFLFAPASPFIIGPPLRFLAQHTGAQLADVQTVSDSVQNWASIVLSDPIRLITGHGFDIATRAAEAQFIPAPSPRSLLFEVWYELGIVGAVAAAAFAASAFVAVGRASPTVAPFLLAELAAGLTISLWGLLTTQVWWVTFLCVGAVAFVGVINGQYRTSRPVAVVLRQKPAV